MKKFNIIFVVSIFILMFFINAVFADFTKIISKNLKNRMEYIGNIITDNKLTLKTKSSGEIISINVKEGDKITKNSEILALDGRLEKLQYDESMVSVDIAKSNKNKAEASYNKVFEKPDKNEIDKALAAVKEARVNYEDAIRQYELQASLFSQAAVTKEQKLQAENNVKLAETSLKKAEASYQIIIKEIGEWDKKIAEEDKINSELQYKKSIISSDIKKINLENKTVYAPFTGSVTKVFVNKGEVLNQGAAVCELIDDINLYAELFASSDDIMNIFYGQHAEIISDVISKTFSGKVEFISSEAQMPERNFRIKVKIDNNGGFLKAGMFAKIILLSGKPETSGALLVPETSVYIKDEKFYIKIKNKNELVETPVDILRKFNGFYQIKSSKINSDSVVQY
ncbi:efflux RND transporter periplasmic adaptor subunit [Candidatus Dependentiae bacterium]|nr:efflux RND transporter periplasmic adaptor subunit [Candidatus Dependentiae bacterium]